MLNTAADQRVHVAVGVIRNSRGEILIAKRARHLHAGGLWEFPGGKVEAGETVLQALQRELQEELAIKIKTVQPFIRIPYDYPDKKVLLDVWQVDTFEGVPRGVQDQPLQWVSVADLYQYKFPEANGRIISALKLPREMMITGGFTNRDDFCFHLGRAIDHGVPWVQVRAHQCSDTEYRALLDLAKDVCEKNGREKNKVTLIANTSVEVFNKLSAQGLHLTSERLMACRQRPIDKVKILGASCHNLVEIHQAEKLQADYITLGPVFKTASHADVSPLGLEKFSTLVKQTGLPVFALGGITTENKVLAIGGGGFGVAGITGWWNIPAA